MTPDVTIKISFGADDTVSASATTTSAAAPSPLSLEALDVASSSSAPAPMTPAEMAVSQGVASAGEAPAPMAIEQLISAGSTTAPAPEPLGALQTVGGPPRRNRSPSWGSPLEVRYPHRSNPTIWRRRPRRRAAAPASGAQTCKR